MRSNMMGVLIKRGKLNTGSHIKGRSYKKDTEKIIIYKPKREAWNTSISHSLQKNQFCNTLNLDFWSPEL